MSTRSVWPLVVALVSVSADAGESVDFGFDERAMVVESKPNANLRSRIDQIFKRTNAITVSFTPLEGMGRASYDRASIAEHWRSAATIRCSSKCSVAAPRLREALSAGLQVKPACPPRFAAMITFTDKSGQKITEILVHESRQCVILDDVSYFIRNGNVSNLIDDIEGLRW